MVRWPVVMGWYGLCFAGALAASAAIAASGADRAAPGMVALALTMFVPLVATLILERVAPSREALSWRPRLTRWLLVASAVALGVVLLTLLLSPLLPGARWDPSMEGMLDRFATSLTPEQLAAVRAQLAALPVHPALLVFPQAAIAGATVNAVFAFGEEIGWRGWLWRELRPLGFWGASLVSGTLWGLWHAPMIVLLGHNYPTERLAGVFLFTAVCVGLTPLHAWVRERGDTVWAAAVLHGTFNAAAGVSVMVVAGPELVVGVQGLAGLLALLVVDAALWARNGGAGPTAPARDSNVPATRPR